MAAVADGHDVALEEVAQLLQSVDAHALPPPPPLPLVRPALAMAPGVQKLVTAVRISMFVVLEKAIVVRIVVVAPAAAAEKEAPTGKEEIQPQTWLRMGSLWPRVG